MSKIIVELKDYSVWGKCVYISNGETELYATIEFGPRIIRYGVVGGVNEMYEDVEEKSIRTNKELDIYGEGSVWKIYGGHRLWHAPEAMPRTYLPDHSPVKYVLKETGAVLTADELEAIGIQNEMEISMAEDGEVTIIHRVINKNLWDISLAPWAITLLAGGGDEYVPLTQHSVPFINNRIITLWPYSDLADPRLELTNRYIKLSVLPEGEVSPNGPFKIGTNNRDGFALYFNHNNLFVKKFDYVDGATYTDDGSNFETYTGDDSVECETIGVYQTLKPDEAATHIEKWSLFSNIAKPSSIDEVNEIVEKYVK